MSHVSIQGSNSNPLACDLTCFLAAGAGAFFFRPLEGLASPPPNPFGAAAPPDPFGVATLASPFDGASFFFLLRLSAR